MSSMQFLRRLSLPRLAYHRISAKNPGVMFLSGFKSNMNGEKALALEAFCDSAGYSFVRCSKEECRAREMASAVDLLLRFDYTGCGSSEGNSEDCLLRDWKNDVLTVLDNLTTGPQILVGSSMGGWLMLLASLARPEKVAGMVGIATAADHLVTAFRQLPAELKKEAEVMGQYNMPSRQHLWWMFSMVGIWVPISRRAVFTTRWNALRSDTGQLQYHTEMQLFVSVLGCENIKLDCVTLTKCWRSSAGQLSTMERNAQLMFVPAEQLGIFLLLIKYSRKYVEALQRVPKRFARMLPGFRLYPLIGKASGGNLELEFPRQSCVEFNTDWQLLLCCWCQSTSVSAVPLGSSAA
ncbi:uncharacterized protein [Mobula birostris]|uniref:uncharacterized protein isoform X3 n=1 Tax=Mobula birostris TaxID=1983395 RepID=UPI003B287946